MRERLPRGIGVGSGAAPGARPNGRDIRDGPVNEVLAKARAVKGRTHPGVDHCPRGNALRVVALTASLEVEQLTIAPVSTGTRSI